MQTTGWLPLSPLLIFIKMWNILVAQHKFARWGDCFILYFQYFRQKCLKTWHHKSDDIRWSFVSGRLKLSRNGFCPATTPLLRFWRPLKAKWDTRGNAQEKTWKKQSPGFKDYFKVFQQLSVKICLFSYWLVALHFLIQAYKVDLTFDLCLSHLCGGKHLLHTVQTQVPNAFRRQLQINMHKRLPLQCEWVHIQCRDCNLVYWFLVLQALDW